MVPKADLKFVICSNFINVILHRLQPFLKFSIQHIVRQSDTVQNVLEVHYNSSNERIQVLYI